MQNYRWHTAVVGGAATVLAAVTPSLACGSDEVRYGRDIRPILSDRCFNCHGPDESKRKAKLRLDLRENALAPREDGAAILPGDPDSSLLWQRLVTHDPDEQMPPAESGRKPLTDEERALIKAWIEQGAIYEPHWAFVAPVAAPPPGNESSGVVANSTEIDAFITRALSERGLTQAPEADRATLCRRVFLDLTGLPPTPDELAAFEADAESDAYERLVRRLLHEEPYATRTAERLTTPWLDIARYADTIGLHTDAGRTAWPYRDWVIRALRDNMPYDQFVVEQLAGDLLPEPTTDQRIASGFNRMHVITDEGGAINDEYLLEYAVDRVSTVGTAFMGLTLGCARCHDHKFDPITMTDFYSLIAFFNNNEEPGLYSQIPDPTRAHEPAMVLPDPDRDAQVAALEAEIASMTAVRDAGSAGDAASAREFGSALRSRGGVAWSVPSIVSAAAESGATLTPQSDGSVLASGALSHDDAYTLVLRTDGTDLRALRLDALPDASLPNGKVGRAPNGNAILSHVSVEAVSVADPTQRVTVPLVWAYADVEQPNDDFRVVNALRQDDADRVWAVDAHSHPAVPRQAMFLAEREFGFDGGTELHVKLEFRSPYAHHSFGRVRLAVSPVAEAALEEWPLAMSNWAIMGRFMAEGDARPTYEVEWGPERVAPLDFGAKYQELSWRRPNLFADGAVVQLGQGTGVEFLGRTIYSPSARTVPATFGSDDGLDVYVNGELVHANHVDRGAAVDQDRVMLPLRAGMNTVVARVTNTGGIGGFAYRSVPIDGAIDREEMAWITPDALGDGDAPAELVSLWRRHHSPGYGEATARIAERQAKAAELQKGRVQTMVMQERMTPRPTFVMSRGQYDQPDTSREVHREVPVALGAIGDRPSNRLGLAQWLVSADNPLLARVAVNRYWEMIFGRGLVETSEDFGYQGSYPTHPELLDWLAVAYRESGWDTHALLERILTSQTYKQVSVRAVAARAVDAANRWLDAFPRQRLSAEQLRDQALFAGGLLAESVGGTPVKPYQPEGMWAEVAMPQSNTRTFVRGNGEDLYRRSLYTYWKRASPPPTMLTLDAPTRESCVARRLVTTTPLQALALWNDPQFVEAARGLAERVLTARGLEGDGPRADEMFLIATGEVPSTAVRSATLDALNSFRARFADQPDTAIQFLSVGDMPRDRTIEPAELAAWTMIANAVLSSDAAIIKD